MTQAKYVKIGGAWKAVTAEFVKIGGAWKQITSNHVKIGGVWKEVALAERRIYVTEQISERCYRIKDDGTLDWYYTVGGLVDPAAVAVDADGNSYWACANNVYKLDNEGNLVTGWPYTGHGNPVLSIAVDSSGNVYTGDLAGVVKKLSSAGVQQWSKSLGANYAVYSLCTDYSAGFVFAGTGFAYDAVYRIVASNGNFTKIYTASADVSAIACDEDGNVFFGQGDGYIRKIAAGGAPLWYLDFSGGITQIVIGHDGYGYCSNGSSRSIKKFARSNGGVSWTYTPAGTAYAEGCGVDKGGKVYGAYRKAGVSVENVIRQVDSSGNWVWSWYPYTSAQLYKMAVTPGLKAAGFN